MQSLCLIALMVLFFRSSLIREKKINLVFLVKLYQYVKKQLGWFISE